MQLAAVMSICHPVQSIGFNALRLLSLRVRVAAGFLLGRLLTIGFVR